MQPHPKIFLSSLALLLLSSIYIKAQTGNDLLKPKDPVLGTWIYFDAEIHPESAAPIIANMQQTFVHFESGTDTSWFATLYNDPTHEYGCISEFIVHQKNGIVKSNLLFACEMDHKGEEISFAYQYNKQKDELIIIFKGKNYKYKRFKP